MVDVTGIYLTVELLPHDRCYRNIPDYELYQMIDVTRNIPNYELYHMVDVTGMYLTMNFTTW